MAGLATNAIAQEGDDPAQQGGTNPYANCSVLYAVQTGDTVEDIAQRFNTSADELNTMNPAMSMDFQGEGQDTPAGEPNVFPGLGLCVSTDAGIPSTGDEPAQATATPTTGGGGAATDTPEAGGGGAATDTPEAGGAATDTPEATSTPAAGGGAATDTPEATSTPAAGGGAATSTPSAGGGGGAATATPSAGDQGGALPQTGAAAEIARRSFVSLSEFERLNTTYRNYADFDDSVSGEEACSSRWVIHPGESLNHVVINCDVPLDVLLAVNPQITDPNLVFPGEVIRVPTGDFDEIIDINTGLPYTGNTRDPNIPAPETDLE